MPCLHRYLTLCLIIYKKLYNYSNKKNIYPIVKNRMLASVTFLTIIIYIVDERVVVGAVTDAVSSMLERRTYAYIQSSEGIHHSRVPSRFTSDYFWFVRSYQKGEEITMPYFKIELLAHHNPYLIICCVTSSFKIRLPIDMPYCPYNN